MSVEERLDDLERLLIRARRFNRRLFCAMGFAIAACAIGIVALRSASPKAQPVGGAIKQIRAERFVLQDISGRIRASLGTSLGCTFVSLELYDEESVCRARLCVGPAGPVVTLFGEENGDKDTKAHAALGFLPRLGGPQVELVGEQGTAFMVASEDGPFFTLYDEKTQVLWSAP